MAMAMGIMVTGARHPWEARRAGGLVGRRPSGRPGTLAASAAFPHRPDPDDERAMDPDGHPSCPLRLTTCEGVTMT